MNCCNCNNGCDYLKTYTSITRKMITRMMGVTPVDNVSQTFIMQMIPHHQAAIEMSNNLLKYTKNCQLKRIAENIISSQTKSIENMQCIYNKCCDSKVSDGALLDYQMNFQRIVASMFCNMSWARWNGNIDCSFLYEMIPHHEGAIAMSHNAVKQCICPELEPVLQTIISSQTRGVQEMQNSKKCLCR